MIPLKRHAVPAWVVTIALLVGCSTVAPTPSPTASPIVPTATIPSSSAGESAGAPTQGPVPPSAEPSPTASLESGWTQVWPHGTSAAAHLAAVVANAGGFVAVGSDAKGRAPVALSSVDGSTWAVETIPGGGRTPTALAPFGDRLLATGSGDARCAHPVGLDTWTRTASGTWTEAPFDPLLCDASAVHFAALGDVGILAGSGPGDNPIVWSSVDGLHWTDRGGAFAGRLPGGVVSDGRQAWILGSDTGMTWIAHTDDGSIWTPPSRLDGIPEVGIRGVFPVRDLAVIVANIGDAVGTIDPGTGGGWVMTPAKGLSQETLASIGQFDGGLFATGVHGGEALAWVSVDGVTWRQVALPEALAAPDSIVAAVAMHAGRAVLIGSVAAGDGSSVSRIWTGPAWLVQP